MYTALKTLFFFVVLGLVVSTSAVPAVSDNSTEVSQMPGHPCSSTFDLSKRFKSTTADLIQVVSYYNQTVWDNETETTVVTRVFFNVSGSVTILNPCAFRIQNFTFSPLVPDTVWYGKVGGNYTIGNFASYWSILESQNDTLSYELVDDVSFENIDTLIMYSRFYEVQLAYVQFPRISNKTTGVSGIRDEGFDTTGDHSSARSNVKGTSGIWWLALVVSVLFIIM